MNKLHLVSNAHLDPVWLWRWQEGFSEILATFRSALDRLNDFPGLIFTSACAAYYEWVEKTDPEMFSEIQQRVKEGRWNIAGGWFIQPDCNIPSGESFSRHALFSQRYFMEKFGVMAKTGYNVDSFGHNAALPQILKLSGLENYVFMRPMPHENPTLTDLFDWESRDGSRVRAYRIPEFYNITPQILDTLDRINEKTSERPMMAFFGVGNHGGGPTVDLINDIKARWTDNMAFSTPDDYFDEVKTLCVPVHHGELQHHARGCYSANSFIKKSNRAAEYSLIAAEAICSLAEKLVGAEYPVKKLQKAWKNLMFDQFHDILGGCSIKSAYDDAGYLFGEIKSITEQETFKAMTKICRHIDTRKGAVMPSTKENRRTWNCGKLGSPIVLFNPHPFAAKSVVKLTVAASKLTDDHGSILPHQRIRAEHTSGDDKWGSAFIADLPPFGYKVYRVFTDEESVHSSAEVAVSETSLDNGILHVEFDRTTGEISSIYDKRRGTFLLEHPAGTALLDETDCDTWAHGKDSLGKTIGSFGKPEFEILSHGSVFSALRIVQRYNESTLRRDYILAAGSDSVRVETSIDFHEKHRAFKLTFPAGNSVNASIPFGSITRPLGTGEEPTAEWMTSGTLGFCSNISYGYDTEENRFRPTIFRSAIYADHYGKRDSLCEYMEQGIGTFTYELFGAVSDAEAKRRADLLNSPFLQIADSFHDGALGREYSGVAGKIPENVILSAVKRGEDGGQIMRFSDYSGIESTVSFSVLGNTAEGKIRPYEIVTVKDGRRSDLLER